MFFSNGNRNRNPNRGKRSENWEKYPETKWRNLWMKQLVNEATYQWSNTYNLLCNINPHGKGLIFFFLNTERKEFLLEWVKHYEKSDLCSVVDTLFAFFSWILCLQLQFYCIGERRKQGKGLLSCFVNIYPWLIVFLLKFCESEPVHRCWKDHTSIICNDRAGVWLWYSYDVFAYKRLTFEFVVCSLWLFVFGITGVLIWDMMH